MISISSTTNPNTRNLTFQKKKNGFTQKLIETEEIQYFEIKPRVITSILYKLKNDPSLENKMTKRVHHRYMYFKMYTFFD